MIHDSTAFATAISATATATTSTTTIENIAISMKPSPPC